MSDRKQSPRFLSSSVTQVMIASVLMAATLPGRTQGLGLITEPLLHDLQLGRVTYASLNLWATLLGALFCFPAGWALDRFRLRWVTGSIVVLLAGAVWRFSALNGSVRVLFGVLLATRALGQSALSVCSITTVARWFPNRAGFAMGIYAILLSVLFAIGFGVLGSVIRSQGWRAAWFDIAVALAFVVAPLVLFFVREPARGAQPAEGETFESGLTLAETLRTGAFWLFASSAAAFNLVSSGLGLFNEAVLAERGFDQKTFHVFLAVSTLLSLAGQFLCGYLTRRWRYQTITSVALLLYAASLALIPVIRQPWQLWVVCVGIGIAGGMIIVIFFSVWSDLFGQKHLGRIQGVAQMLTVLSSALGPVLFARCAAWNGSYGPLLVVLAVATLGLAAVARFVRAPRTH